MPPGPLRGVAASEARRAPEGESDRWLATVASQTGLSDPAAPPAPAEDRTRAALKPPSGPSAVGPFAYMENWAGFAKSSC
jgi:hypothetical protein